jgi:prolipoprotein diacylglyceryltransferase
VNEATFARVRRAIELVGYGALCLAPLIYVLKAMEYNSHGDSTWQYVLGYGFACMGVARFFQEPTRTSKIVFAVLLIPVALLLLGIMLNILR